MNLIIVPMFHLSSYLMSLCPSNWTYLFPFSSTHERWFEALVVNVTPQISRLGYRGSFGFLYSLVNFSPCFFFDILWHSSISLSFKAETRHSIPWDLPQRQHPSLVYTGRVHGWGLACFAFFGFPHGFYMLFQDPTSYKRHHEMNIFLSTCLRLTSDHHNDKLRIRVGEGLSRLSPILLRTWQLYVKQ